MRQGNNNSHRVLWNTISDLEPIYYLVQFTSSAKQARKHVRKETKQICSSHENFVLQTEPWYVKKKILTNQLLNRKNLLKYLDQATYFHPLYRTKNLITVSCETILIRLQILISACDGFEWISEAIVKLLLIFGNFNVRLGGLGCLVLTEVLSAITSV